MPTAAKNELTDTEVISTSKLLLSPNPAQQSVNIACSTCDDNATMTLINVSGNVLTSTKFNQSYVLNLQHYPAGMYFIKVQNRDAVFAHKLLIIK
ncbi:MAG: T9SS type A sorting domain-containing protein [Chitinophagales bacterium]|nr:T9SS type A sorting domain-containing protein [Bacteroidota bacterium]